MKQAMLLLLLVSLVSCKPKAVVTDADRTAAVTYSSAQVTVTPPAGHGPPYKTQGDTLIEGVELQQEPCPVGTYVVWDGKQVGCLKPAVPPYEGIGPLMMTESGRVVKGYPVACGKQKVWMYDSNAHRVVCREAGAK